MVTVLHCSPTSNFTGKVLVADVVGFGDASWHFKVRLLEVSPISVPSRTLGVMHMPYKTKEQRLTLVEFLELVGLLRIENPQAARISSWLVPRVARASDGHT